MGTGDWGKGEGKWGNCHLLQDQTVCFETVACPCCGCLKENKKEPRLQDQSLESQTYKIPVKAHHVLVFACQLQGHHHETFWVVVKLSAVAPGQPPQDLGRQPGSARFSCMLVMELVQLRRALKVKFLLRLNQCSLNDQSLGDIETGG